MGRLAMHLTHVSPLLRGEGKKKRKGALSPLLKHPHLIGLSIGVNIVMRKALVALLYVMLDFFLMRIHLIKEVIG
jgi:hypothetical protein